SAYVNLSGSDRSVLGTSALPLNTWSHLAETYDGSSLKLYVNGVLVSSRALTGSITTSGSPLRIGGNSVWGEYFNGLIDEVRVYNRALSQGEVQADLNTPVGGALDNVPPTAAVTSPGGGSSVSGVVNVSVNAADNVGVAAAQLLVN